MILSLPSRTVSISSPMGGHGILHLYSQEGGYLGMFVHYKGSWELRAHKDDHGFSDEELAIMLREVEKEFG